MRPRGWKLLISLALVVIIGSVVATSAFAAPPTPTPPSGWGRGYGMMGGYDLDRVAKLFGISQADLVSQLQQGRTLAQIAQDKGVSEDKLVDTLIAPYRDQVQLRVKYGYLTQEQADTMLQWMTERVKAAINTPWNGGYGWGGWHCGGFGMMGGFGGMMGGYGGMMGGYGRWF